MQVHLVACSHGDRHKSQEHFNLLSTHVNASHDAGPDPVRAIIEINRLRLFPAVFTVPPDAEAKLPSNWGEPCAQLVTSATATLTAVKFQVSFPSRHKAADTCTSAFVSTVSNPAGRIFLY